MIEVRKWNYGDYSSSNYGAHCIAIAVGQLTFYFSYDTIVAFSSPETGLVVHENDWSTTTGKHLNQIDRGNKKNRIPASEFEAKLKEVLKNHNLEIS